MSIYKRANLGGLLQVWICQVVGGLTEGIRLVLRKVDVGDIPKPLSLMLHKQHIGMSEYYEGFCIRV